VTADALAYAYKYSGQTNYLAAAAKFYATGSIDPAWEDDPPVYLTAKDLVKRAELGPGLYEHAAARFVHAFRRFAYLG